MTATGSGRAGAVRLRVVGGSPSDLRTAPGRLRRAVALLDGTRSPDDVVRSLPATAVHLGFDRVVLVPSTGGPLAAGRDARESARLRAIDLTALAAWCRPPEPPDDPELVSDRRRCAAAGVLLDDDVPPPGYVLTAVVVAGHPEAVLYGDLALSGEVPGAVVVNRLATFAVAAGHVLAEARLREQVRRVTRGSDEGRQRDLAGVRPGGLSGRETDVVRLMSLGRTNAQIGRALEITEGTVKSHVKAVFRKLGAVNRADAVARWLAVVERPGRTGSASWN